jgi:hypothetical protein
MNGYLIPYSRHSVPKKRDEEEGKRQNASSGIQEAGHEHGHGTQDTCQSFSWMKYRSTNMQTPTYPPQPLDMDSFTTHRRHARILGISFHLIPQTGADAIHAEGETNERFHKVSAGARRHHQYPEHGQL